MEIISLSMALDPTDLERAKQRMKQAAMVVEKVPAFFLSYPRDLKRLPELCETLPKMLSLHLTGTTEDTLA